MRFILMALFLMWGGVAIGSELPKLYAVVGISADRSLPIRTDPNTESEALGAFVFDASGVEVLKHSSDGNWGLVNIGERTGWSEMEHLTLLPEGDPKWFYCFGVEPAWALVLDETGKGQWYQPDNTWAKTTQDTASPNGDSKSSLAYEGIIAGGQSFRAELTPQSCSDGMSDNAYGVAVEVSLPNGQAHNGCCTLQR